MRVLILSVSLFLVSCTIRQAEQEVEAQIHDAIQGIEGEIEKNKSDFQELYQKALTHTSDTTARKQLAAFEATLSGTNKFIDSLRWEMNRMELMDVNNSERVRILFMYKGVGDTLLSRLKSSSSLSISTARTFATKAAIKSVSDSLLIEQDAYQWKARHFESMNSLAASMILYGIQTEVLKMGKLSIRDY